MRLGNERSQTHVDLQMTAAPAQLGATHLRHLLKQIGDGQDVLVGFGGQTDHKIELDRLPAGLKGGGSRVEQILVGHPLIDDVAQPLGASFRGKRQPCFSHPLDFFRQLDAEVVDAQRGKPNRDTLTAEVFVQTVNDFVDVAVVGTVQRGQGYLVEAGVGDNLGSRPSDGLYAALTGRAIEYAGLTEAATPRAATGNLDLASVMDDLGPGALLAGV